MTPSNAPAQRSAASQAHLWLLSSVPVIMVLMFVLPYTLLREVNAWYGSFLLWTVGTVVVIGINVVLTRHWKD